MSKDPLNQWDSRFRSEAKADGYSSFDDYLELLSTAADIVPGKPERLLEGTVLVVRACCAYWSLDGEDGTRTERFLELQRYANPDPKTTGYILTFDLHSEALARIVIENAPVLADVDLADLYGHPWWEYKRVGYDHLYISRSDWGELTSQELEDLEAEVTYDIRYDYSEDELDLWFEPSPEGTCLIVSLQDRDDEDI